MTGAYAGERLRGPCTSGEWVGASLASRRLRRVPKLAVLVAIGMLVVSLSGCASAGSPTQSNATGTPMPTASSAPTSLRMNPRSDGLFCATQLAWSPDSTHIAVVGNAVNCSGSASGRTPGLILVYAVASGKLIQELQPDTSVLALPAIAQKVAANSAAGGTISTLTYQSLTWTPDSQALLMTFDLELLPRPNDCCTSIYGLQRLGVMDPSLTNVWLDTNASPFNPFERWNLTSGAADVAPAPMRATGYQWNADGTLAPASPAVGQSVGASDGGRMFTVWQPGELLFGTKSDKATGSTTVIAQDVGWVSYVSPVSPDGHYFYPNMVNAGSLVPPSTQHAIAGEPVLQPHDQALVALAQQMMRTPSPSQNTSTLIAWRPDGRYLAARGPDIAASGPDPFTVSIYDTASGKLVKQITPDFTGLSAGASGSVVLLWSPDGSRLLQLDNLYGAITVWGPGALPA